MQRILFIVPAMPDYAPYVENYLSLAKACAVPYDVFCWNRKGESVSLPAHYHVYQHPTDDAFPAWRKLVEISGFCRFVRKEAGKASYSSVVVFTVQNALLFRRWLVRHFPGRFVLDIRDYSPILGVGFFRKRLVSLLRHAAVRVISSAGFKRWLPGDVPYVICHNIALPEEGNQLPAVPGFTGRKVPVKLLTIGALRDAEENIRLIDALRSEKQVALRFVGEGHATPILQDYCRHEGLDQVFFSGRYKKAEEDTYVRDCDMMNLLMSDNITSNSLMSNRFYLAARFCKPILASAGSYQAELVKQYGLGLVVSASDDVAAAILSYWDAFDPEALQAGCVRFLEDVYQDMMVFKKSVQSFFLTETVYKK